MLHVCYVSPAVGLGHISRLRALAQELDKQCATKPEFLIFADEFEKNDLGAFECEIAPSCSDFVTTLKKKLEQKRFTSVIFDLYPKVEVVGLAAFLDNLKLRRINLIAIDCLINYHHVVDLIWIPSFIFLGSKDIENLQNIRVGWDTFILKQLPTFYTWVPGSKVTILTGGSDVTKLGDKLPTKLDESLKVGTEITWVRGPFASKPKIPKKSRLKWKIITNPTNLHSLFLESNYVLTAFGVTFFEVIQYGIPTVVFSPFESRDHLELGALQEFKVASTSQTMNCAVRDLVVLMNNDKLANKLSVNARDKMKVSGAPRLAAEIKDMADIR